MRKNKIISLRNAHGMVTFTVLITLISGLNDFSMAYDDPVNVPDEITQNTENIENASSGYINDIGIAIGLNPIREIEMSADIIAKWEAEADGYSDMDASSGAQFIPTGKYGAEKELIFCAIVENPGLANEVYEDIYYPENIALGDSYLAMEGESGTGCGKFMSEINLEKIDKSSGIDLFCDKIKNLNTNLPKFENALDYGDICGMNGKLNTDAAAVFCGKNKISFNNPSGEYVTFAVTIDKNGKKDMLQNKLTYLPITALEADFTSIDYGDVKRNAIKTVAGDSNFDTNLLNEPTVRNAGNTRLAIKITEDDIGLGKTNEKWNVTFQAKAGEESDYKIFDPNSDVVLDSPLNLSQTSSLNFSISVLKYPESARNRMDGSMILSAEPISHLSCK